MSRFVNAVIVGLASFIVLLSIFWYAVEVSRESQITIRQGSLGWGPVDQRGTEVWAHWLVHNPHRLNVQLNRVEFRFLLNGEQLEWDNRTPNQRIPALGDGSFNFTGRFPTTFVQSWINTHAAKNEETTFLIRGDAAFLVGQETVKVPFEASTTTQTRLTELIGGAYRNCTPQTASACLSSANARLINTGSTTQIWLDYQLENPNASHLRISNWTTVLELHDVQVADGETVSAFELEPHGDHEGQIELALDPQQLVAWWPLHAKDCERSSLLLAVTFTLEERREIPGNGTGGPQEETIVYDVLWRLPGGALRTSIVCPKV